MIFLNISKRPLAERLNRLDSGRTAHEEYIPSIIDAIKKVKVPDYLIDFQEEQDRLRTLMGLSETALSSWSYEDLAAHVADRYHSNSSSSQAAAADLMDILAMPMLIIYKLPPVQRSDPNDPVLLTIILGQLQLLDLFEALERRCGDGYSNDVYYSVICEALTGLSFISDGEVTFGDEPTFPAGTQFSESSWLAEAVAMAMYLPEKERANILYHIIVEPFL